MKSLTDIVNELNNIANSLELEGPVIDSTIQLLANSIYKNEIVAVSTVLEASPSRCRKLNSAIKHAYDNQYSVPRGYNQRIKFRNIESLVKKSVNKFDLMGRVNNYGLYYAQSYNFEAGKITPEIEVILGNNLVEEELQKLHDTYLSSVNTNISEDFCLIKNSIEVPITNMFTEFGIDYNYLVLTDTEYSIDIYTNLPILAGETYLLRYIPYMEDTIDPSIIKQLPGFRLSESTTKYSVDMIPRLEDIDKIFYNSMVVKRTGFIIKSKSDLTDLVNNFFSTELKGVNIVIEDPSEEHVNGVIHVYYLMTELSATLSESRINEFKRTIKKAYYVLQDIVFEKATPKVPEKKVKLTIHYHTQLLPDEVTNIIYSYQYYIGENFNLYKIMASILSNLSSVSYIDVDDDCLISLELNSNEYIRLEGDSGTGTQSSLELVYESTVEYR